MFAKQSLQFLPVESGRCERSGYNRCARAPCFHHATGNKRLNKAALECVLLCHNCHAEEHDRSEQARYSRRAA